MKELSIEQKAKRYDKALEIARKINSGEGVAAPSGWTTCEVIFPELKESEDEKIRKEIIEYLKDDVEALPYRMKDCNAEVQKVLKYIAWLEKQDEQKPTDKVELKDYSSIDPHFGKPIDKTEPKFKVGDWVVYDHKAYKVVTLPREGCINLGLKRNGKLEFAPSTYCRLWTVQDAKDGDVLAYSDNRNNVYLCIFREYKNERVYDYCTLDTESFWEYGNWNYLASFNYAPATKEQCDTLMKAMTDAGYIFDFEKKELRKIKQKNAWSEEDERMYRGLHNLIYSTPYCDSRKELSDWLKSIKDVVQTQPKQEWKQENIGDLDGFEIVMMQIGSSFFGKNAGLDPNDTNAIKEQANILLGLVQKQEWSKEDEKIIKRIDSLLYSQCKIHGSEYEEIHNWLKSLRPQSHWKPSDEQIKALVNALSLAKNCGEETAFDLRTLYEQLKKLMEK